MVIFMIHAVEEYITGFYHVDPIIAFVAAHMQSISQSIFLTLQFMWWILLIVVALLITSKRGQVIVMVLLGLVLIFEFQHLVHAVVVRGYYPGLITALGFPVIAFLYLKELTYLWRKYDK